MGQAPCPEDDGEFCNGQEQCDEQLDQCVADPPCDEDQACNEDEDKCIDYDEPDPEPEKEVVEQEVRGGACCACEE